MYMPAENQRHAGSKGNGHDLGKLHDVNGTKQTPPKNLGPHDIDAGNHHHQQHRYKPYPLKPVT
jgi:hypothetical protein